MSIASVFNDTTNAAADLASNTADVVRDTLDSGSPRAAGEALDAIVTDDVIEAAGDAASGAFDLVTDDAVWGEDIGVDQGGGPRRFGYGENKETLFELRAGPEWSGESTDAWNVTTAYTNELAAKLRAFGHADADTFSASIGLETENGWHGTSTQTHANGTDAGRDDTFAGLRGRAFGEAGPLGVSTGEEAFLGISYNRRQDSSAVGSGERWRSGEYSVDLGLAEALIADVDVLGAEVFGGVRAGLDVRSKTRDHEPLAGGVGLLHKGDLNVFVGGLVEGGAEVGATGFEAGVDAFAGARATYRRGLSLAYDGTEIAGGFVQGELRAGVGVSANVEFGLDWEEKEIGFSGEAGAAVGLGLGLGAGVTIAGKDLGKAFGVEEEEQVS